jgi:hypothetical protein
VTTRTKNQEPRTKNQIKEGDKSRVSVKKEVIPFTPPTQEEVREYMESRGWRDSEFWSVKWFEHYTDEDWKIRGGKRMSDWQKAVHTWERPERMAKTSTSGDGKWDWI